MLVVMSEQCTTRKTSWQTDHKTPKHLLRSWWVNTCLEVTTMCSIDVEFVQLLPKVVTEAASSNCCTSASLAPGNTTGAATSAIEVNMLFYIFAAIEMLAGQGIYLTQIHSYFVFQTLFPSFVSHLDKATKLWMERKYNPDTYRTTKLVGSFLISSFLLSNLI